MNTFYIIITLATQLVGIQQLPPKSDQMDCLVAAAKIMVENKNFNAICVSKAKGLEL